QGSACLGASELRGTGGARAAGQERRERRVSNAPRAIVIRRKRIINRAHGGSWKIALADFMTALMALFLVLWLLSSTDQAQRESIAEYFRTPLLVAIAGG